MLMRVKEQANGRALRGRRGFTTFFYSSQNTSSAGLAWTAFNNRATADGALLAEVAVNNCLFDRYNLIVSR